MSGKITIADVAARAGVSRSTISHVLSCKRPISEPVRKRVLEAIAELGYRPSMAARMLKGEGSKFVAALVDNSLNPIAGHVIQALTDEFRKLGYALSVCVCGDSREEGLAMLKRLSNGFYDGILNLLPQVSAFEAICACQPLPVLTYIRDYSEAPVHLDIKSSCYEALNYLWDLGHRKIGIIVSMKNRSTDNEIEPKFEIYKMFMSSKGAYDPAMARFGESSISDGIAQAPFLKAMGCTAIFCGNDQMAAGVLSWAKNSGLKVPGDFSVIGYDDSPIASLLTPALTTIQNPVMEIARPTAKALIDKIEGRPRQAQQTIVTPRLIIRESSGPVPMNARKEALA